MHRLIVLSGALVVIELFVAGGCDQRQHADVSDSDSLRNTRDANRVGSDPRSGEPRARSSPAVAERVRVVTVPSGGIVPDAEVDRRGVIHLAYFSNGDVWYTTSSDNGRSFRDPIRVNTEAGFAYGGGYRGPDLAVGKDERIHVVWYNAAYQQKRPKDDWGVMYSRLSEGRDSFEPARNLNQKPSDNYSLAADDKGNVAVIWMAEGVYASISKDGGDSFSAAMDLETDPCECCGSRTMFTTDETLCVLYRDKAENDRDTYLALLANNARQFEHTKVSQTAWYIDSCPMTGSFLSPTSDGMIAAWETKGEVFFARLEKGGQMTSAGEVCASDNGRYPAVLTAPDGLTVVAWKNATNLEWQLFDTQNKPLERRGSESGSFLDRPAGVATKDGVFLLFH